MASAVAVCAGCLPWLAAAQTPPVPTVNHSVAGWTNNLPPSTLTPDLYACSPPPPTPGAAIPNPLDRYDSALLTPSSMTFGDPALHILLPPGTLPSLIQFQNLLASPAETYIDFPFTTTATPDSDVILNQAAYSMNSSRYGSQFHTRMVLVDVGAGNAQYPLGGTVSFSAVRAVGSPNDTYFFVNNQAWPLTGSPGAPTSACGPAGKFDPQPSIAGTLQTPVPLKPGSAYILRAYLGLQAAATDRRAMFDDLRLYMQAVNVNAQNDGTGNPAYSFAAASGGTTPSVLANDQINATAVPANAFTLTQLSASPGLTLNATTGAITAAAGQPGTKTLTYQLCPKYDQTTVPGFVSSACKTAVATLQLTGPAAPPQVSVSCTPATLTDSPSQEAVCTVRADTSVTNPLVVSLQNLASTGRFSGTCTNVGSITIPAGSDSATCTIVATDNTVPGDGDVPATLSIADNAALYTVGTRSAVVTIQNDDAAPVAVPSLQQGVMALLGLILAALGALGLRQRKSA